MEDITFNEDAKDIDQLGGNKKAKVNLEEVHDSFFSSVSLEMIENEQMIRNFPTNKLDDMLQTFPFLQTSWKSIYEVLDETRLSADCTKGEIIFELLKSYTPKHYSVILGFFTSLVLELKTLPKTRPDTPKAFNDDILLLAALGIYHTNDLLLSIFVKNINSDTLISIDSYLNSLKLFHEFFYAATRFKCNAMLNIDHLNVLESTVKRTFNCIKGELNYPKYLENTPTCENILLMGRKILYYLIQTLGVISVFGESEELTKKKYEMILENFKEIFVSILNVPVMQKIFSTRCDFDIEWTYKKGKYSINSFGQKLLTLFIQEGKIIGSLELSLRYMILYYNYKVLKLMIKRQISLYEEKIITIICVLLYKCKGELNEDIFGVMYSLNESILMIKTIIGSLVYYSMDLDFIQRQRKFDAVKDSLIDNIFFSIKAGLYWNFVNKEQVANFSVFDGKDFVARFFKTTLLYKKLNKKRELLTVEEIKHIDHISTGLLAKPIINETTCFYLFKLYFIEFLLQWDLNTLKEKQLKYNEEIKVYLEDFDEESSESDIVKALKKKLKEIYVGVYVDLAKIDCASSLEATISLMKKSINKERKLYMSFYILLCILIKKKITVPTFQLILNGDSVSLKEITRSLTESPETESFIKKKAMNEIFSIYKHSACAYMEAKNQTNNSRELKEEASRSLEYYAKILNLIGPFIYAIYYSVPMAKHLLEHPEFDEDFYVKLLPIPFGQDFIINIITVLSFHLTKALRNGEMFDKFAGLVVSLFTNLTQVKLPYEEEKAIISNVLDSLERVLLESVILNITYREIWQKK